jgi:predicted nucleic acid-binding Zn ribbon protein
MRSGDDHLMKWELTRERFRIEAQRPPSPLRPEKSIREILSTVLDQQPAADLPTRLTESWPVIAGGQIAQHTRPVQIREQILYVYADHPGWLAEIRRFPKNHILKKLKAVPGLPQVCDIRFALDPAIRSGKWQKNR